ncbi:MAG: asparagine synthetase B, partial [Myxococcota bacterium]|nr:asparagine synthetase B [Myxococcota bacterium]
MGAALAQRGPDGRGELIEPGIALGCRRLAAHVEPHAHQPVTNGRFAGVVHGSLSDHAAERARLTARGAAFRTGSDAEVWVHAFADAGDAYLAQARGSFALAMWDRKERRLVLARDRFGICPLMLTEADDWLLFASEIKALFATGMVEARIDPRAIDHVFACLCASPARSAFAGIKPLPAGHRVIARDRSTIASRFADLEFPGRGYERRATTPAAVEEVATELDEALTGAVARRLAAEAPVATYLTSGLDSSLLLAMAARNRGEVTAFTIGLDGLGPDEAELAAVTARRAGAAHVIVPLDAERVGALFPEVVLAAEVPVLDHGGTAMLALAREVRARGFKTVLSGAGADEAFAGNPWTARAHRSGYV